MKFMLALAGRMRMAVKVFGAAVLALHCSGGAIAQTESVGNLKQRVMSSMRLLNVEFQTITAKPLPGRGIVQVPLTLDDQNISLRLVSHSLRSPNFQAYTRGVGGVLTPIDAPAPTTYRGQAVGRPDINASASLQNGRWSIQISDEENTWWIQPLSDAFAGKQVAVDPNEYIVYKQSDLDPNDGTRCGLTDAEHIGRHAPEAGAAALGAGGCLKVCEIACDTDFEYFTINGSDAAATTADIESIINGVDFIYRRDCGITYLITAIIIQSVDPDPYVAVGSSALLAEFKNHWNTNQTAIVRDVAHMFTGQDIDPGPGGVIGVAYWPGVCTATDAYGLVESQFTSANPVTFAKRVNLSAHELGHNWNSLHCNQSDPAMPCAAPENVDCGIMCSSLSGCSQSGMFEPCSADMITAYANTLNCLGVASAPVWTTAALPATDVLDNDRYGTSVCISGNLAIVGAGSDDVPSIGTDAGSAYIYRFDGTTWIEEAKLINPTPWAKPNDRFGTSVAITSTDHGDVAVVGAYLWDWVNPETQTNQRSSGTAYVYRHDGLAWELEQPLVPSDHAGGDLFGLSVSIDGDLIGVGAEFNDDAGSNSGCIYLFRYAAGDWNEEIKIFPADGQPGDNFGVHMDVQEGSLAKLTRDVAVVGAWSDDDPAFGTDAGSVYVFRNTLKTGWVLEQKLLATDGQSGDRLGLSVGISGDVVIAGAPFDDDLLMTSNTGSAYIFRKGLVDWTQEAKITASDAAAEDQFGFAVAVDVDAAIVGGYLHDGGGTVSNTGQAYIFRNGGTSWVQESILTGPTTAEDQFGYSVSISNGVSMVGSWLSDNAGPIVDGGSVFIGTTGGAITDCNLNTIPDDCDIAGGTSMDVNVNGIPDECEEIDTCPGDVSEPPNGTVDIDDLVIVIVNWGACPIPCPPSCPGDITQNCVVDIDDLVALVTTWGNCRPPPP